MTTTQTIAPSRFAVTVPGCGTFVGRQIGKCRTCKAVIARESRFSQPMTVVCQCGARVTIKGVWGTESAKECNDKCMGATGPSCECACGGHNHGGRHL